MSKNEALKKTKPSDLWEPEGNDLKSELDLLYKPIPQGLYRYACLMLSRLNLQRVSEEIWDTILDIYSRNNNDPLDFQLMEYWRCNIVDNWQLFSQKMGLTCHRKATSKEGYLTLTLTENMRNPMLAYQLSLLPIDQNVDDWLKKPHELTRLKIKQFPQILSWNNLLSFSLFFLNLKRTNPCSGYITVYNHPNYTVGHLVRLLGASHKDIEFALRLKEEPVFRKLTQHNQSFHQSHC